MSLVECPSCRHKVLSVATVCPHCGFGLAAHRNRGRVACRKCGYEISAKQADCPHCGTSSPGSRYPTWVGPALIAAALLLVAGGALWTQIDRFTRPSLVSAPAGAAESGPSDLAADQNVSPAVTSVGQARPEPTLGLPDVSYVTEVRWASTWVNVRENRSADAPVVRTLNPGDQLEVDSLAGGWWRVYLDGRFQGYIADRLLLDSIPMR